MKRETNSVADAADVARFTFFSSVKRESMGFPLEKNMAVSSLSF